jgi:hypothetical protein
MTVLLLAFRPLLLLAARLLLYMGIARLAISAFQAVLAGAAVLFHHLIVR